MVSLRYNNYVQTGGAAAAADSDIEMMLTTTTIIISDKKLTIQADQPVNKICEK